MTLWFLSDKFNGLALSVKAVLVLLHLSGVVLVVLWARFVSRRFRGRGVLLKLFDRLVASPSEQKAENAECTTSRYYENEALEKPKEEVVVWQHLLSKGLNILEKVGLHCLPNNEGNNQRHYESPTHAGRIIDRFRMLCQSIKTRTNLTFPPFLIFFSHYSWRCSIGPTKHFL